jgi:catalase
MIKNIILLSIILSSAICVEVITLNNGAPVDNARNSLTAGARGPILL